MAQTNLAEDLRHDEPESDESGVRPRDGKAQMKEWLANLKSPWKEVYQDIKSRDPKGHPRA